MAKYQPKQTVRATDVVQVALLPEHAKDVETRVVKIGDTFSELTDLAKEGYNITISYDKQRSQWNVRLAGIEADCLNAGKLLYGNGEDLNYAFAALYVKHFLVSKGLSWEQSSPTSSKFS